MDEAFARIHFAKVRLNKEEGRYEIIDNFNKVSFTGSITEEDRNYLKIEDLDHSPLFCIVKNSSDSWSVKSPWGEEVGVVVVQGSDPGPTALRVLSNEGQLLFHATKMPLIIKNNEFQVTTSDGDVCGRINSVRSKAIMSMQPELKAIHRIQILASSIVLLGIYNECW